MTAADSQASAHAELARAKVNLTLRVLGRRPDGYHELESIVVFADVGDRVAMAPARVPMVEASGPFARAIAGTNLLERAISAVTARWPQARIGSLSLEKNLPVAAGLGGGSADAAAALRAIRRANRELGSDSDWRALALTLGSDVPACLESRAALMRGRGDRLEVLAGFPSLDAVIVNPMLPLPTADVFAALMAPPYSATSQSAVAARVPVERSRLLDHLALAGNDLEPPAVRLCPAIEAVLGRLRQDGRARLARMSGSGPTCFALYASAGDAKGAAADLKRLEPQWWVRAVTLG
ncbi:MAG: 4-(cytidine 5'-diphospho)-2-C-methyl-D-erythritol kinase [Hyphomicrobiaceae bacterium]|nr:MAG: 4-(cytidine 5'-diphospho)-2-C-methyl-D-erythritol kinase [Hyphomicrobiaceae bacterium]